MKQTMFFILPNGGTRAMTNTERQQLFRKRHPGYYARLQATKRASTKRRALLLRAELYRPAAGEPTPAVQAPAPKDGDAVLV